MRLMPEEQRGKDWPKVCMISWLSSFERWADTDEGKQLTPATVKAIKHALQCNLLYIEELEAKLNE